MAEHYGTLAEALTYHDDRGNAAWADAATDALRTAALVRATTWLDAKYAGRFMGWRTGRREQALAWPRTGAEDQECNAIPSDEIPVEVKQATFEAALRELATPGSLTPDYVPAERVISEKVGPISTTYASGAGTAEDVRPVVSIVEDILYPLLGSVQPSLIMQGGNRWSC